MKGMHRLVFLSILVLGSFIFLLTQEPDMIYSKASYVYADTRSYLGIPNFFDVFSNLAFLVVGVMGLLFLKQNPQKEARWSWRVLFMGVVLVTIGSSYYHWGPAKETLLWDRLPMTLGFMGLLTAFFSEFVDARMEKWLLVPLLSLGLGSVMIWYLTKDIRLYAWVQFFPLILLPFIMILFHSPYTHKIYLLYALLFYILAKVTEHWDVAIFKFTGELISGHSIKHLLAAVAVYNILHMLQKRERIT